MGKVQVGKGREGKGIGEIGKFIITVAQRGIQLIFHFANFLALGESFMAIKIS